MCRTHSLTDLCSESLCSHISTHDFVIVAFCHSAAAIATLGAVAHAVITSLMGEEITVLVADAASQTHLKAH